MWFSGSSHKPASMPRSKAVNNRKVFSRLSICLMQCLCSCLIAGCCTSFLNRETSSLVWPLALWCVGLWIFLICVTSMLRMEDNEAYYGVQNPTEWLIFLQTNNNVKHHSVVGRVFCMGCDPEKEVLKIYMLRLVAHVYFGLLHFSQVPLKSAVCENEPGYKRRFVFLIFFFIPLGVR